MYLVLFDLNRYCRNYHMNNEHALLIVIRDEKVL